MKDIVHFAIALVAVGAHDQRSNDARELHVTFPVQDHVGEVLKPSLLEGLDIFTNYIAKHITAKSVSHYEQWDEGEFLKQNNVSSSGAFCLTVADDTSPAEQDGDEELVQWAAGVLADNRTMSIATKTGHAVGHWCCRGHLPNQSQLATTQCYQTDKPGALEQVWEGGRLQMTVGADGSTMMGSVKGHVHSGLIRSDKTQAQSGDEANDPRIYPTQIFMASLRDGVRNDSIDLAVEQLAHLARATSGLIVVDKQLFGGLVRALGRHPARFRVIEKPSWFSFFSLIVTAPWHIQPWLERNRGRWGNWR